MRITRKILASALTASVALTGASVVHAQSSNFLLSSSSTPQDITPAPIDYEEKREELRSALISNLEDQGFTISSIANEDAQAVAEALINGGDEDLHQQMRERYNIAMFETDRVIPNILLDSEIDRYGFEQKPLFPFIDGYVAIGISGNDENTVVYSFKHY